jgi:hypothetical protein
MRPWARFLASALLLVLTGLRETASDRATEELLAVHEAQRGVAIRDGRVVRRSTFYLDADGWSVVGRGVMGPFLCHKMLCAQDHGKQPWHWSAPPHIVAALSRAYGGRLVIQRGFFEIVKVGDDSFPPGMPFDISIESGDSGMKVQQFGLVEFGEFAFEHSIELDTTGNWTMESGRPADESTLQHVLGTAARLLIRGGYYRGNETAYLRSVQLLNPRSVRANDQSGGHTVSPDAEVCDASGRHCRASDLVGGSRERPQEGLEKPDLGTLERALQQRDVGMQARTTLVAEVSGRQGSSFSSYVARSEDGGSQAPQGEHRGARVDDRSHADAERARKQRVEAEMQARRLGRSVVGGERRAEAVEEQGDVQGSGARGEVEGDKAAYQTVWDDEGGGSGVAQASEGRLLSCGAAGRGGGGRGRGIRARQDLLRAASEHGMPLNACLVGETAAFGLAGAAVMYVANGNAPQVVSLAQVESVSTDSNGAIVFLGAQAPPDEGSAAEGEMQPVLLRGCQMSAFDLDAMTNFFELVQEVVAGAADMEALL